MASSHSGSTAGWAEHEMSCWNSHISILFPFHQGQDFKVWNGPLSSVFYEVRLNASLLYMKRGWSLPESTLGLLLFWFAFWLRALCSRKCNFQKQFRLCWKVDPVRNSGLQKHCCSSNRKGVLLWPHCLQTVTHSSFLRSPHLQDYAWFGAVNNIHERIRQEKKLIRVG